MTDMRSRLKRSTRRVAALGAVSYAAFLLVGCGGATSATNTGSISNSSGQAAPGTPAGDQSGAVQGGGSVSAGPGQVNSTATVPAAGSPGATAALQAGIPAGAKVERTANLALEVRSDAFDTTLDKVFGVMRDLKGYVSGSDLNGDSGGLRSGTISFRVPSASFEDAIQRVRALGTVKALTVGGADVSGQYVDLQARLKNQQAQEQAMLALYSQARTVPDIVAVQNQLATIQDTIERLKGQISFLDSQVDYSTLTVSVTQAGVGVAPGGDDWGFRTALVEAAHYAVNIIDVLVLVIGAASPVLLMAAITALVARHILRQRARSGPGLA
jgi:hypothetical protein